MKNTFLKIFLSVFVMSFFLSSPQPVLAQFKNVTECQQSGCRKCEPRPNIAAGVFVCVDDTLKLGPIRGIGPIGFETGDPSQAPTLFASTLSKIIGVLTVAAILWFVLQIILASYGWMSAGGDAKAIENARSKLTNAIVGLIVVFFALVLASVIGFLLGIPNILDVGGFIKTLSPQTN